ncbi:hypothetical protein JM18_009847 [Phytophthora kernoviae]|uniref:Adenylate kinase active site lid domain-containing protein n=1 Tax=Phytophthora kernoviae TaxID=325452 RepID=A0A921S8J0_9STRA|nr:hypothetical protein JM18_009847 [Phytophthora kernoviae]
MPRFQPISTTLPISTRQFSAEAMPSLLQRQPGMELRPGKISPPKLVILGNILRQAIQNKTPLGIQAQRYMDYGELVPDDLVVDVVLGRLAEADCATRGWLLDGFPRTAKQAEILLNAQGGAMAPDCVLELEVPDKEVIRRIAGRRVDPVTDKTYHVEFNPPPAEVLSRVTQRSDDTEVKIRTRLEQFHAHSNAVRTAFENYRGDCGLVVQVIRASGYQAPPATAQAFADAALKHAAQRSLTQIRCNISERLRRRIDAGTRGVYRVPDPVSTPSFSVRVHARSYHSVSTATRFLQEHEPRVNQARGLLRSVLRRLR